MLLAPLTLLALTGPLAQDDRSMGWTGVLDEASFAALHERKEGQEPVLLGEEIRIGKDRAYLSLPKGGPPRGGVVVIHEWWGLNDHVEHYADRLAADGYAALAVDLYGGVVATTREDAMKAMQSVDEARAVATMRAAHDFLVTDERTKVDRTASLGWCFGGGMSLALALAEPQLDAAIVYYGRLVSDPEKLTALRAPVLGVFGNRDTGIPPSEVAEFAAAMKTAGRSLELAHYDAEHAFANPSSARYDAANAASAWERSRAFLVRHLRPAPGSGLSNGSRKLEAFVPPSWKGEEGRAMRSLSYQVGTGSDCSVIALAGAAGGLEPNLARWCQQMGAAPLDDEALAALPRLPMLGMLAPTLKIEGRFQGMSGGTIEHATLVGAVCALETETVFVKLVGPTPEVEAELDDFAAFCRSLR